VADRQITVHDRVVRHPVVVGLRLPSTGGLQAALVEAYLLLLGEVLERMADIGGDTEAFLRLFRGDDATVRSMAPSSSPAAHAPVAVAC
jgi:hypothetical protein